MATSPTFAQKDLYGGAIAVELPTNFGDVSDFRQVPDTQEVYLDVSGLTSVIFDILERVGPEQAATDEAALKYHFDDVVSGTGDTTQLWLPSLATLTKMPNIPTYTVVATQHPDPNARRRPDSPDFTGVLLTLVRLEQQKTDIIITVNVPHVPGEYNPETVDPSAGKTGPLLDVAQKIRQKIFETFEVKDFGLFVQEEQAPVQA